MQIILKYFPQLSSQQIEQLSALYDLYQDWNSKINVISRKDIDHLYEKHVLHSLAIAKWIQFKDGTKVLDIGCGGGFPGIPLAILFPNVDFHLVDSISKKLTVVNAISENIGLPNIRTTHSRVEEIKSKYDFIGSRAVANLTTLLSWTKKNIAHKQINAVPNGLICLKGGNLKDELASLKKREYIEQVPLSDYYEESFFEEKYIVYLQV